MAGYLKAGGNGAAGGAAFGPGGIAAGAALGLATSAYKEVLARRQLKQAKQLANKPRPLQTVEQPIIDDYNASRLNYATNSSAQAENALNAIDGNNAQTVAAATQVASDPNALLASMSAAEKAKNRAIVNVSDASIRAHQQDLSTMMSAGRIYANELKGAWDWNKKQPYQDAMLAASSLTKAGQENQYGALNDVADLGIGIAMNGLGGGGFGDKGKVQNPFSPTFNAPGEEAVNTSALDQAKERYGLGAHTAEDEILLRQNGIIQ